MNTKQMLEDFWKDVMEVRTSDIHNETICIVTDDDMQKYTRKLIESLAEEIIGEDTRHITDTKDIQNIVDENEGNVSFDEIANEMQKDIDAENRLRAEQRLKVKEIINSLK